MVLIFQYRYGKFLFRDQLSVTFNKADESPYGAFSEYAKLNPYWRAYNDDGSIREVMGITRSQICREVILYIIR